MEAPETDTDSTYTRSCTRSEVCPSDVSFDLAGDPVELPVPNLYGDDRDLEESMNPTRERSDTESNSSRPKTRARVSAVGRSSCRHRLCVDYAPYLAEGTVYRNYSMARILNRSMMMGIAFF